MNRYTPTAIALHWLSALLILTALPVGLYMVGLPLSPTKLKIYSYHKWIGVTIFLLAVIRLGWRITHPAPPLPDTMPRWQRSLAESLHVMIYLLIFAIPLSGWMMSSALGFQTVYLGVLPLPDLLAKDKPLGEALAWFHGFLNCSLAAILGAHILAALKHHFIDRDDVLARMLPLRRR